MNANASVGPSVHGETEQYQRGGKAVPSREVLTQQERSGANPEDRN